MAKVRSNSDELADLFDEIIDSFDFTVPGRDQTLGRDLVNVVANGIRDRSVPDAINPEGGHWEPNSPEWAAYKAKRYQEHQPGILGGQMLSPESLKGQALIQAQSIEMVYGTGSLPPDKARNGMELRPYERDKTDREKATYFSEDRPFYLFDERIAELAQEAVNRSFDEHLDQFGL